MCPGPAPSIAAGFRSDLTVWRIDLTQPMHAVLEALASGTTLGNTLSSSAGGQDVATWFRRWIADGMFVDVVGPAA